MKRLIGLLLFTALALSSCKKSDPHESCGKNLIIEIPELATDTDESYVMYIDDDVLEVGNDGKVMLPTSLEVGEYSAYLYNEVANITIASSETSCVASVDILDDGTINSNPGLLYFGTQSVNVSADDATASDLNMAQITRELNLSLSLKGDDVDHITQITVLLDGVAQQWDCLNNSALGEPSAVATTLTQGDDSTLSGTINLLGIDPEAMQKLTISIKYDDSYSTSSKVMVSDLSTKLKDFNSDKSTPFLLSLNVDTNKDGADGGIVDDNWVIEIPDLPATADGDRYTIYVDGEVIEADEDGQVALPDTMAEGDYIAYLYNEVANITFTSSKTSCIASVDTNGDGTISGNIGLLYFGTQGITIAEDGATAGDLKMEQITGAFNLTLSLTGNAAKHVTKVTVLIDGVAQQWDCLNDTIYGEPTSVATTFTPNNTSTISGTIYLLGIDPDAVQKSTITIEYDDSYSTSSKVMVSDLSTKLKDFNNNKSTPFSLSLGVNTTIYNTDTSDDDNLVIDVPDLPSSAGGDTYVYIDGEAIAADANGKVTLPDDFEQGEYTAYLYNEPDNTTIVSSATSCIASVDIINNDDNIINDNPGLLYFGTQSVKVTADGVTTGEVEMVQITRELNFDLTLSGDAVDNISKVTALLDGVAQQWDCVNNTIYGDPFSVTSSLKKIDVLQVVSITRAATTSTLSGKIYLLGVDPTKEQKLTITLEYTGDNPSSNKVIVSDISTQLGGFNDDKATPLTLTGSVATPTDSSLEGNTIIDWSDNTKEDVTIN